MIFFPGFSASLYRFPSYYHLTWTIIVYIVLKLYPIC
jgi:hypothetical protein